FSDGLEELIYRTLTRMEGNNPDMWVIPASDMKEQQVTSAREAFDVFGANLVLQGKFSRTSQNLKLQLKLIQPNTYQILRSMDISLPVEEVTHFQEKVIDALRSLLELPVRPEQDRMQSAGLTSIGSAYQSYLEGKGLLLNYDTPSNVEQSIDLFKQAIAMDSVYALAYAGLGEAYWRKYEHTQEPHWTEEAIRYCEEALRINNYLPQVYLTLGIIRRGRGEYELSREALENVIRVEPQNGDAYRELASTYSLMKNSSAAEKMYQKAIEHHPNYWANYYDLGRFYYHQGRYEEAVANFQKVTEIAPYNYKGFRNLGVVKLLLDDYPGARKNLEQSIAIKPNYGAYSNLGTLHFIRKEYQQAARMFEQALEMNANFYALWGNLASCYAMLPDESFKAAPTFQQAINLAERQLTVNPNNSNILKSLASYYAHLNNSAKATELIERVLQLAGDDLDVQFRAAEVYGRLGQMDKALNMLQQLVKKGFSRKMILQSPVFQNFQEDERFKEALFSQ
ncbi:MAG: tetratricopeptide repeat protein, partial [Calditrichaeota bacterium]